MKWGSEPPITTSGMRFGYSAAKEFGIERLIAALARTSGGQIPRSHVTLRTRPGRPELRKKRALQIERGSRMLLRQDNNLRAEERQMRARALIESGKR
jgi:hypothetical protein